MNITPFISATQKRIVAEKREREKRIAEEKLERKRLIAEEKEKKNNKKLLLQEYLGLDMSIVNFSDSYEIINDRWKSLWRKREQLLWIKKINNVNYSILNVISDYMNGKITKESITKIYKELTKSIN